MLTLSPIRHWFRERSFDGGWRRFVADLVTRRSADSSDDVHPFDRAHGVDTSGLLYADKLATGHAHDAASEGYYATAPSLFHGALGRWQATLGGYVLQDYSFIDLGCGKGRVLMMASDYPFLKVSGVELSRELARIARRNLAAWLSSPRACRNVTLQVGDVMELRLPDSPVLLFLFNAFGAEVMTKLLEGLVGAAKIRATPIDLISIHPEHDGMVRQAGFESLADEEIPFSAEDAAADAFEVSHDRCSVFRLAGLCAK